MSERPDDEQPDFLQLMDELDRLEEEQRELDLRDPAAVDELQRKIDALREKIARLAD
jgi:hypothetical protein